MAICIMVIHVKDEKTDWLVRDFAKRRGLGITEAIRQAVQEASEHERESSDVAWQKVQPLLKEIRSLKVANYQDVDSFLNEMSDGK